MTGVGDDDAPAFAPNYLPWKEFGPRNRQGISWLAVFQQYIKTPYFLRNDDWSEEKLLMSPEMWFSAVKGSGAKTHADGHCESTISIQLSGRKRWRIGPMHPVNEWGGPLARADDGSVKHWYVCFFFLLLFSILFLLIPKPNPNITPVYH